jgi:hypothetical protein
MSFKRLAIVSFLGGSFLKTVAIIIWRLSRHAGLMLVLTKRDPAAFYLAERATTMMFDQKRLFPGTGEALFFEAALVIAFGIECLVAGLAVGWCFRRKSPIHSSSN